MRVISSKIAPIAVTRYSIPSNRKRTIIGGRFIGNPQGENAIISILEPILHINLTTRITLQ